MGKESLRPLTAKAFGDHFAWGVAIAAAQNEGGMPKRKGAGACPDLWDVYARKKGVWSADGA